MGISRALVSLMRSGERAITPEVAAELADIAGEDARQAVIDAIIERNAAGRKGPLLREILGKALAAGVAAVSVISYNADSIYAIDTIAEKGATANVSTYRIYLLRLLRALRLNTGRFGCADRAFAYG